ncbi:MAG: lytic transglycosylase domain-containing protein [Elusimicrobiota bacterium]
MKKPLILFLALVVFAASLLYFEFPWTVLGPVFLKDTVNTYSRKYGVDPLLVIAVIKAESNFSKSAKSSTGAAGLMQLMPSTAEEVAKALNFTDYKPSDLENPDINIQFGVYYLAELRKEFRNNNVLALAAYNAGKSKVQIWYKKNPMLEVEISDIPYDETRRYVKTVMRNYKWLKWIQNLRNLIRKKTP